MKNQKLGIDEFTGEILERVSSYILSDQYIEEHKNFVDNLIFDLWKKYSGEDVDLPIKFFADIIEIYFFNFNNFSGEKFAQ